MAFTFTQQRIRGAGFRFLEDIRRDLQAEDKVASQRLIRSLKFDLTPAPSFLSLQFKAEKHWVFVDEGRKPGGKMPPEAPIRRWLKQKGIDPKLSFVIRRSIAEKGIKATNIFKNNIAKFTREFITRITPDLFKDIEKQALAAIKTK